MQLYAAKERMAYQYWIRNAEAVVWKVGRIDNSIKGKPAAVLGDSYSLNICWSSQTSEGSSPEFELNRKLCGVDPRPLGEGRVRVQTGNMIYRTNRAHGLQWIGKEEIADAVEGNQCHGTTNSIDS